MNTTLKILALLGGLALIGGCASPEARIGANQELFTRLAPEQQALVREGKVGIGFDKVMVRLALGEPDRVVERTDATGTTEIWNYVTYENSDGAILYTGAYHHYWRDAYSPYYLSTPAYRVHEHMRVMFRGGKVVAFEHRK